MKTFVDVLNAHMKDTWTWVVLNHGVGPEYLGPTEFSQAHYTLRTLKNTSALQQALKKQEQMKILQLERFS